MQIKQSEVYDNVLVTEFCVFLTRRGTVTNFFYFSVPLKTYFRKKNSHHVSRLTIRI